MNFFQKIKTFIRTHKKTSIAILIVVILVGYWGYKKATNTSGETRYVLAQVETGTIISSVTGTGQVSASEQIDIKPTVSGTITGINVNPGDSIKAGKTLFTIDDGTAQKAVRDAQISLQSAQLALQKLQIQNSTTNTNATLAKAYSDGFNAVSATFSDLQPTITGIENLLSQNNLSDNTARGSGNTALNYRNTAEAAYYSAFSAYQKNKNDFSVLDYNSPKDKLDALINETYLTAQLLATASNDLSDYINYLSQDSGRPTDYSSYQTTISGYITTTNNHVSSLLTAQTSIQDAKDTLPNNNIDLQNAQITVTQKQNALTDARQTLSDYYIQAPFDGVIASVPILKGDTASSGTVLGTIITAQQVAIIPLNEVDVAKIQLGQKVTLTFDAVPDLTISGKVVQIDSIGTVSSGVVNYNVKISFDASNPQIKPGMSVNANIITNIRQDVLTVPNGAVKTQNGASYVQMFDAPLPAPLAGIQGSPSATPPRNQTVEIGISNDTNTEIVSGLKEGDNVVAKTITTTSTTTASAPSIFGAATGNRAGSNATAGGGAANRALRGD